jgi:hypothetical protein
MLTTALLGVPVAALAAGLVYADAAGRGLPSPARLRWALGVAAASLGGFLVAFGLEETLVRAYLALSSGPLVVTSPRQLVASLFAVGLAVSAGAVLAYGVGSRYGPFAAV